MFNSLDISQTKSSWAASNMRIRSLLVSARLLNRWLASDKDIFTFAIGNILYPTGSRAQRVVLDSFVRPML